MKVCQSTKTIQGCGKEKSDFRSTRKWVQNICDECINEDKRLKYKQNKTISTIASIRW